MANFLSNLLNRFTSEIEVIHTRPISRFEPQNQLDLSPWAEGIQPTGEVDLVGRQPSALQIGKTKSDLSPQSTLPTQAQNPKSKSQLHPDGQQTKSNGRPTSKPPAQLGYLVVEPHFHSNPSIGEQSSISKFESRIQGNPSPRELPRDAIQEEGTPPRGEQAAVHPQISPQKPGKKNVFRSKLWKTTKSPEAVGINPQNTPARDSSLKEQVINVTIGRVEIQAVPPTKSTKTAKQREPSPIMSLDDYLKSRDQERQA